MANSGVKAVAVTMLRDKYSRLVHRFLAPVFVVALAATGALGTPAMAADSAVILIYHRFGEGALPSTNIRIDQFESHIAELTSGAYTVLGLGEIVAALKSGTPLPDRTVAITIDDAYASVYQEAFPRLQAAGLPFTLFVSTGPVDDGQQGYAAWSHLREMAAAGVTIGNHTVSHAHMLEAGADANVAEITGAGRRIEDELGQAPTLFAYPFGEYSLEIRGLVGAQGFEAAVAQFSAVAWSGGDLLAMPRFALNEKYGDMERFRLIVNALPLPVKDVTPADPLLATNPPAFGFTVSGDIPGLGALQCFPSHLGAAAAIDRLGTARFEVRFGRPLPRGRSRINCTMLGPNGRWRWFGAPFFVE